MKAIFPALCGALLLATSLPAAAAPQSKAVEFGAAKISGSTIQAGRVENSRQHFDRQAVGQVSRANEYKAINQYSAKPGRAVTAPGASSSMNWGGSSTFSVRKNLND